MENKSHAIVAVSFLIIFAIGSLVFYLWLSPDESANRTYVTVTDHSVGGLQAQSPVKFKGLKAGHVKTVRFAPDDPNKVQITFVVLDRIPMTESTYAQLSSQGITGLKTLNLSNPDPSAQKLTTSADHPTQIPLQQGLLAQLKQSGKQDMQKINRILDSAQQLLSEQNQQHLSRTMAQMDQATQQLVAAEHAVMPALEQLPALTQQTRAAIAQLDQLVKQARGPVGQAGEMAQSVQSLSDSATTITRKLNNGTLPRIDALTRTMNQAADHINQLSRELKAKPQSVIFGPPEASPGPGEPGFGE